MDQKENREDEIQTKQLPDLPLTTEQAEETKGGAGAAKATPKLMLYCATGSY